MRYKYETLQVLLCTAFFIHIILGLVLLTILIENGLDIVIDAILVGCWVFVVMAMSVLNHKIEDKIKENKISNLNKQMRK